jgi:hypothetical protein
MVQRGPSFKGLRSHTVDVDDEKICGPVKRLFDLRSPPVDSLPLVVRFRPVSPAVLFPCPPCGRSGPFSASLVLHAVVGIRDKAAEMPHLGGRNGSSEVWWSDHVRARDNSYLAPERHVGERSGASLHLRLTVADGVTTV